MWCWYILEWVNRSRGYNILNVPHRHNHPDYVFDILLNSFGGVTLYIEMGGQGLCGVVIDEKPGFND